MPALWRTVNCQPFGKLRPSALSLRLEEMTLSLSRGQLSTIRQAQAFGSESQAQRDDPEFIEGSTVNCRRWRRGFSLIEIVLSLFLILGLVSILLTASGTLIHSRNSGLQSTAAKIASRQIETLRNTSFASLPGTGTFTDSDLAKLPSGIGNRTITDYSPPDTTIKLVKIQVDWIESGVAKNLVMETFISENGL